MSRHATPSAAPGRRLGVKRILHFCLLVHLALWHLPPVSSVHIRGQSPRSRLPQFEIPVQATELLETGGCSCSAASDPATSSQYCAAAGVDGACQATAPTVVKTCTTAGDFALTFDDGSGCGAEPVAQEANKDGAITREILRVLRETGAKATFFVKGLDIDGLTSCGNGILKEIVQDGHTIGVHGWDHSQVNQGTWDPKFWNKMLDAPANLIETQTVGYKTSWFRAPMLMDSDGSGQLEAQLRANLASRGFKGSVGASTYGPGCTDEMCHFEKDALNGSVHLFHDNEFQTTDLVERLKVEIEKKKKAGKTFVNMDECIKPASSTQSAPAAPATYYDCSAALAGVDATTCEAFCSGCFCNPSTNLCEMTVGETYDVQSQESKFLKTDKCTSAIEQWCTPNEGRTCTCWDNFRKKCDLTGNYCY